MLTTEAVTCLRSRLTVSAGSFPPCSPEDRCTCTRPGRSRCRWHYLHRAWTSTGECLFVKEKDQINKSRFGFQSVRSPSSSSSFHVSVLVFSSCLHFQALARVHTTASCHRAEKLRTRLVRASSSSAPAAEKRRVSSQWRSTGGAEIWFCSMRYNRLLFPKPPSLRSINVGFFKIIFWFLF